ncbi:unnamed protein product [Gadus morhua 'NCC']
MPKRKNDAKTAAAPARRSSRLADKPDSANPAAKVAKKAAPKKVAKGKKAAAPAENGDAKTEAPKVEAAGDAK